MKKEDFSDIFGEINSAYISESEEKFPPRAHRKAYKYIAAAASAAIVIAVALAVIPIFKNDIVSPPEESATVIEESKDEESSENVSEEASKEEPSDTETSEEKQSEAFEPDVSYEVKEDGSVLCSIGKEAEDGTAFIYTQIAKGYLAANETVSEISVALPQRSEEQVQFWETHYSSTMREISRLYDGDRVVSKYIATVSYDDGEEEVLPESPKLTDYYSCPDGGFLISAYPFEGKDSHYYVQLVISSEYTGKLKITIYAYDDTDTLICSVWCGYSINREQKYLAHECGEYILCEPLPTVEKTVVPGEAKEMSLEKILTVDDMKQLGYGYQKTENGKKMLVAYSMLSVDTEADFYAAYGSYYKIFNTNRLVKFADGKCTGSMYVYDDLIYFRNDKRFIVYDKSTDTVLSDITIKTKSSGSKKVGIVLGKDGKPLIEVDYIEHKKESEFYDFYGNSLQPSDALISFEYRDYYMEDGGFICDMLYNCFGYTMKYENINPESTWLESVSDNMCAIYADDHYTMIDRNGVIVGNVYVKAENYKTVDCNIKLPNGETVTECKTYDLTVGNINFTDIVYDQVMFDTNSNMYLALFYIDHADFYKVNPGYGDT